MGADDDIYFEREERAIYTASRLGTPAALKAQSVVTSRTRRSLRMVCASSMVSESEKASRPNVGGARGETRRTHTAPHQHTD